MDWKKAKMLMIYLFIVLDIFLGYYYFEQKRDVVDNFDVEEVLGENNIKLDAKIPTSISRNLLEVNYKLFGEQDIIDMFFDEPDIKSTGGSTIFTEGDKNLVLLNKKQFIFNDTPKVGQVSINNEKEAQKFATEFLKDRGLYINLLPVNVKKQEENLYSVEYEQIELETGFFLEDCFCIVYVTNNGIRTIKYQVFDSVKKTQDVMRLSHPKRKLLKIVSEPIAKDRTIVGVSINYSFNPSNLPLVENVDKITGGIAKLALRVELDNGVIIQIE
ncbi:MAG: hypothetical protein MSH08_04475 [Ezakiella sp.]|nr:hypothetical protein [Ezakiella sp.]MDD7472493.1 hypothetical protein [Bacillota bacterium]MDY3923264.1 hypothetical protein [Ezakiella sp.]